MKHLLAVLALAAFAVAPSIAGEPGAVFGAKARTVIADPAPVSVAYQSAPVAEAPQTVYIHQPAPAAPERQSIFVPVKTILWDWPVGACARGSRATGNLIGGTFDALGNFGSDLVDTSLHVD